MLPGAASAVQLLSPSLQAQSTDPFLLVQPPAEAETARTQYYDSYLEELGDTELSYSELGPESENSFASVTDSEEILQAAELTLVNLHSTAIMTGPSFATVQQNFTAAFTRCQAHAKKLPITEHDLAEAKRLLPGLRDYLTQAKAHLPEIGGLGPGDPAVRLHNTISQFVQEATKSIADLAAEIDGLQSPASDTTRSRAGTGSDATKASVWRKSLKRKVQAGAPARQTPPLQWGRWLPRPGFAWRTVSRQPSSIGHDSSHFDLMI